MTIMTVRYRIFLDWRHFLRPLSQLLDFLPQGYPEVSPSESIQFRMLFIICKNKYRKYRKPRQQIKRTHFPWNLSKRSVHSTFSFQSSVTGCCSPGSLWPCSTNQNVMATGVDTSENFDTVTSASWQSWQWDTVSSWTDVIFSSLSHSCWTSCPRALRRWVLPNQFNSECCS